ncbi:MAG TPA: hypothetical protein VFQ24_12160 [Terriglobia bacterium]|nr:hypothetical protein [Terriglobia bacterium]
MKQTLKDGLAFAAFVATVSVGISLSRCEWAAAQTSDSGTEIPIITVWLYNYAGIPKHTMARAEREVQKILDAAAIRLEWVECPTSAEEVKVRPICQELMSNAELGLTILPTARGVADAYVDRDFGISQVFNDGQFGHYAYVFYDRVQHTADLADIPATQLLGSVIAHEFGHLLLRSSTHTGHGIMRMRWDRNDLKDLTWGQLNFTPEEAETIHAEVLLRLRSAGGLAKARPAVAPQRH